MSGLTTILRQGESQTVEFKESFQEETLQAVGAFANTSGGTLFIGIERYGSGIQRMLDACRAARIPEPTFEESTGGLLITFRKAAKTAQAIAETTPQVTPQVAPQVTPQVMRLLKVIRGIVDRSTLQAGLGLKARKNFRLLYLAPALAEGLIEMTVPNKPNSRLQKYRLTTKGRAAIKK